jgi:ABC-type bacteriocin/lantibiotic exporter with double-glycine peptidase domain
VQFIGALAIVLYYDKAMALLALASAPFLFLSSRVLVKTIRKYNKKTRELNGEVLSFTEESVRNIQLIKSFDLTKTYIQNFGEILKNYRFVRLSYDKFSILMGLFLSLVGVAISYSCYALGVFRLWQGAITFGTMTLFLQLSGTLSSSFNAIASMIPSAISIATAARRVMEVTSFEAENDLEAKKAFLVKEKAEKSGISLNIKNLSFGYDEKTVLDRISLEAKSGETIALTGQSGEGKTTLLKLILGLVTANDGDIYFETDGERISASDSTRRLCTYVPQTMEVFSQTIAENLRIVKPEATLDELWQALETAELYDFVKGLPEGLNTIVNQSGNNFSQGQLQRLSIARALLRDAPILIMDEATSALDIKTEEKVLSNIMAQSSKKLCIVTTHRESMLKYCDKVYKINAQGELIKI